MSDRIQRLLSIATAVVGMVLVAGYGVAAGSAEPEGMRQLTQLSHSPKSTNADLVIERLRCEYLENPMGIDVLAPRLSWVLQSKERGQKQTAYRILVASSSEFLAKDQGDLWDSGKVAGDQTIQVVYQGKPLQTRMQCFWKVQVWDKDEKLSQWSDSASWSMGLLKPTDWQAKWIAAPAQPSHAPHNGYHSELAASPDAPQWVGVDLGANRKLDGVRLYPAHPYDWSPDTPGFMFPVRFKIEAGQEADFSDAKTVLDESDADVPNPGLESCLYRFPAITARYVRLSVNRLAHRDASNYAFALAEMEVLLGEDNIAQGAPVIASSSIESGGWAKSKLVDGLVLPDSGDDDVTQRPATMLRKESHGPSSP